MRIQTTYLGIGLLIILFACQKIRRDNSIYMETLTYSNDKSTYQREWHLNNQSDAITAIHIEEDTNLIVGKRSYWMNIASPTDQKNNSIAAYIYDNEIGVLNGKFTLRRLYSYEGEKYLNKHRINFKGTFEETIVYFDKEGIMPNDTTFRKGTFVLEYKGKEKN
ncbi:MAG: hypothetical protein ABI207_00655 [Crocinitomicaceae bacterium]